MRRRAGYEQDFELRDRHIEDMMKAYVPFMRDLISNQDRFLSKTQNMSPRDKAIEAETFVEATRDFRFLASFFEGSEGTLRKKLAGYLLGKSDFSNKEEIKAIRVLSEEAYAKQALDIHQSEMREGLKEVMPFLPPNITIEIDERGQIAHITDLLANKKEDLNYKIKQMKKLISQYNDIVSKVERDLESLNVKTRLLATMTAIIMETGIRPGGDGESWAKDEKGRSLKEYSDDPEGWGDIVYDSKGAPKFKGGDLVYNVGGERFKVKTFGATNLKGGHLKLYDTFATLKFEGKSSTINLATISNPKVIQALRQLVDGIKFSANDGGLSFNQRFLFSTEAGDITKNDLAKYFKQKFDGIKPNDFRKLRATTAVFESLKAQQEQLRRKILEFAETETEKLEEKVKNEIIATLQEAVHEASMSLNHFSGSEVTIKNYINPTVILNYIQNGGVSEDLRDAVLNDPTTFTFDPRKFIEKAKAGKTANFRFFKKAQFSRRATLGDLLEELSFERMGGLGDLLEGIDDLL